MKKQFYNIDKWAEDNGLELSISMSFFTQVKTANTCHYVVAQLATAVKVLIMLG